jgi:hypothetical protein
MQSRQGRQRSTIPPRDLFPTSDEIFDRVQEMFSSERAERRDYARYWQMAEAELLDRAARRVIKPDPSRKS